jgi:predicted TIM-barrel fold metal-dependent hydrolase
VSTTVGAIDRDEPMPGDTVEVRLVDADVHPTPRSKDELRSYLAEPWRSRPPQGYEDPSLYLPWGAGVRADSRPAEGPAGSDRELLERQLLNDAAVDYAMLLPIVRGYNNPDVEAALAAATNAWMADTWLGPWNDHGRYRASINVCADHPEDAVREIERWAGHPWFAQVRVNTYTDAAFGNERYHPIYAAASRHGLPVCVHFSKSVGVKMATPVGHARSYFEVHSMMALNYAAQLVSLIMEGVFARFPSLTFVFVEGGFSWLLPLLWRMDNAWSHLKDEVPLVSRKPSEYVRDNVRFTTQPIEEPPDVRDLLRTYDLVGADSLLMFSTDYPHWDFDNPQQIAFRRMPDALRDKVMFQTALDVYDLPPRRDARTVGMAGDDAGLLDEFIEPPLGFSSEGAD